ncbi:hypothetical protein HPA02_08500 [Bisbaumannia pacifica]|uniref:Uncharacterized protein n=1 Tax=Bisbaumannia pacifica TaxID=77098 RepID=A0A510X735_9GAMM|nr:hypothetical protein [Halomonas pacifica]GEK46567.1 hypothetical protein HPA02_08500 [Halomonas pacifica]
MELTDLFGIAVTLLMLGGLVMTQVSGGIGTWLLVSWVGIPAFFLLAGLLANTHGLLFGAAIMIGIYAFRRR